MKVKIESDVFDIVERIKDIDENYYILFNSENNCFELHNSNQLSSYCLTIPYNELNSETIDLILFSFVGNIDNIIDNIDNNNNKLETKCINSTKNICSDKVCDIYNFSNNSSKKFELSKAFSASWR